jgi:hypothetical protein
MAKELNVSNCWMCWGALMSEEWCWKGTSLNAYQLFLWNRSITRQESNWPQTWILTLEVIGEECTKRTGSEYEKRVGETPCERVHSWNGTNVTWWPDEPKWYWTLSPSENGSQCHDSPTNDSLLNCFITSEVNPFQGISEIGKYWNNFTNTDPGWWRAPDGLFWICGKQAIPNSLGLGREAVL